MPRYRSQTGLVTVGRSGIHSGTTPPSPAHVGQRWFNTATAVTYQYTRDANGRFWLDISSGGIGAATSRGVDFVGDTDPHLETNGSGLAIGSVYYNREADRYFVCTTATTDSNVWAGRFAGSGGLETTYKSGSDFYKIHTFLGSGTFFLDGTTSCDILVIAGGGAAGASSAAAVGSGGGGGAGGFKYYPAKSITSGIHTVTIGAGGVGSSSVTVRGIGGTNSSFGALVATGGGGGGTQNTNYQSGTTGGSGGGGAQRDNSTPNAGSGTTNQGNDGGDGFEGAHFTGGGGGGAGAAAPDTDTSGVGGAGGAGYAEGATVHNWTADSGTVTFPAAFRVGSGGNLSYAGGGGGASVTSAGAATHGGGAGSIIEAGGSAGVANTGGGGGGDRGSGGSGIVIVRYQLNA